MSSICSQERPVVQITAGILFFLLYFKTDERAEGCEKSIMTSAGKFIFSILSKTGNSPFSE